ncbi:HAD domain-containing protein [Paucibacter sp. R3-3]|uniref:HAD domain-containing protein n=1 Tax=Roseateles agri TaxID=3098619 RepID=A0ABU5DQZ1_9BURK|nr:HAD domain-containing protein [Paucibacter sp. R3-3]MDY0748735.1 HAD domain-containing protein [Paucibacter sp. R3-3]
MVLFLDFDGVLHPYPCPVEQYFCRRQLLEGWLRERPDLDVVISSNWRERRSLDELRGYFSADLQSRVIGVTPVLKRQAWAQFDGELPPMRFERETEVKQWLHGSGEPWRRWAALDDQAWMFGPFCKQLVLCDGAVGLTPHELGRIDTALALRH